MNVIRNEKLIKRNARIAQISMLAGLVILAGGMIISFRLPEQFSLSLAALVLGFILSQIGVYFLNRWGRSPRPDELLTQALKGLDGRYTLYHYTTPASHLLVGPSGVWVLIPQHQRGKITYTKGRWRQSGGGPLLAYLKLFAQEGLGRPDLETKTEIETIREYLQKHLPEEAKAPEVQAALVFTNPQAVISIPDGEEPPAATVNLKELKDLVRKPAKGKTLSPERARQIQESLEA